VTVGDTGPAPAQQRSRPLRAIFFGTPEIAVPSLDALAALADVRLVITQPDKPAGRGLALAAPPVKTRALALGLRVEQPTKVRTPDFAESLRVVDADVAVVIAYGRILPRAVLDAPKRGCVNLHASLLPRWRGAAPIQWCIVHGDRETGISLMQMDDGMDTGPVLATRALAVGESQTAGELAVRLGALAADVVRDELPRVLRGELAAKPQDAERATMAPVLKKEDGRIAFAKRAREVHDLVRGMSPWPGAFTTSRGGAVIKVHRTGVVAEHGETHAPPGTVVVADARDGVHVACGGGGVVALLEVQAEGKKRVDAQAFANGRGVAVGDVLGGAP
jgi:methionyl-tRNA formyltransferase